MDTVREAELSDEKSEERQKLVLFPVISIGDAP
jgi:hypothetical protein